MNTHKTSRKNKIQVRTDEFAIANIQKNPIADLSKNKNDRSTSDVNVGGELESEQANLHSQTIMQEWQILKALGNLDMLQEPSLDSFKDRNVTKERGDEEVDITIIPAPFMTSNVGPADRSDF